MRSVISNLSGFFGLILFSFISRSISVKTVNKFAKIKEEIHILGVFYLISEEKCLGDVT